MGALTSTHPPAGATARPAGQDRRPASAARSDGRRGLLGRAARADATAAPAKLDALFALPSAAMTLEASLGLAATGVGSVCFRAAEGAASAVVAAGGRPRSSTSTADPQAQSHVDDFGFTWLTVHTDPPDMAALVTDLHAVNTAWRTRASGPACSARWSPSRRGRTAAADVRRLPLQARHVLPVLPDQGPRRATTCVSASCATPSAPTCRSRRTPRRWLPLWGIQE